MSTHCSVIIHSDNPALKLRSSCTNLTNLLHYNFCMYNVCFFLLPRKEAHKANGDEADHEGVGRIDVTLDIGRE